MKSLLLKNKSVVSWLLKLILHIHNKMYQLAGPLAIRIDGGTHPKHRIIKHKEWFYNNIQKDWVILDIGCNTGLMPEVLSKKAKFVYGLDNNCSAIDAAKIKMKRVNIEYICADATKYDYSKCRPINCITLSNVLEHIENRVDFLKKLLSQVNWEDRKRFLVRVPMLDRDWITLYKKELGIEYKLDPTHYTEYTFDSFVNELAQANIKINSHHVVFGEIYAICEAKQ